MRNFSLLFSALTLALLTLEAQSIPNPASALPPANDRFADAVAVVGNPVSLTADLFPASAESFEPFRNDSFGRTAWWRWTASVDGLEEWVNVGEQKPVSVSVYTQDQLGQLSTVQHGLDQGSFPVRAGTTYWIQLDIGHVPPTGFSVYVPPPDPWVARVEFRPVSEVPPTNDSFTARIPLNGVEVEFGGSLRAATFEPGEPALPGSLQRTRWWTWRAPGPGTAKLQNLGTNPPAVVGIYRKGALFQLERVADSATEFGNECARVWRGREAVEWDTSAGQDYEIQLDRNADAEPDAVFALKLSFTPAPANDELVAARELTGTDLALVVNNYGATLNPLDPVLPFETGAGSVWFHWTLPGRGIAQVTTNEPLRFAEPSFEILPAGGAWTGGSIMTGFVSPCAAPFVDLHPLPPFAPIFGIYRPNGGTAERPQILLDGAGTNVAVAEVFEAAFIQFDGHAGTSGEILMNLLFTPPPTNDDFKNRIVLPAAAVKVGGRTFAATSEANEPPLGVRNAWWEWKAPSDGQWVLRPKTGQYSHRFLLGTGTNRPTLAASVVTEAAPLIFSATAGDRFTIFVAAKGGFGDNVAFTIEPLVSAPLSASGFLPSPFDPVQPTFHYPADFDLPFVVETSVDLIEWKPLGANGSVGYGTVREVLPEEPGSRFYRTRLSSP